MEGKIKTSILIDEELWERFRSRVGGEQGLRRLSRAVEEALENEVCEDLVVDALEKLLEHQKPFVTVTPVKPKVDTSAGKIVRELRESRL